MNFFTFSWVMVWRMTSALPGLELLRGGQFAVQQQVGDFQEAALFRQLLDGVAAIAQNAFVAIQIGDRALAGGGIHEGRIVGHQAEIVRTRS